MIEFCPFENTAGGFVGREASRLKDFNLAPQDFFQLTQVHGDRIVRITETVEAASLRKTEGDALVTDRPRVPIAVRAADCVPILIAHPDRIVAAVHAGWKGTQAEVLKKTLDFLRKEMGVDLSKARLAIGPAICGRCYEVGEEVASAFSRFPEQVTALSVEKFLLDLKAINLHLALEAGVDASKIEVRPECTLCDEKKFYSYRGEMKRGEKGEGRNVAWVMLR